MNDEIDTAPDTADRLTATTIMVTDPGDATGRHVESERFIAPGTLHETAEVTRARMVAQGFDVR